MIKIEGKQFKDEFGRTLMLRGVNLGGSSKVPYKPNGATWNREGFYDHRNVTFIGRPFPLQEADEHFSRLRLWGFTFLRFLITWEAIEHAGPGEYDEAYLDYLYAIVKKAGDYGIEIFIDPHQDVWSRFSGGDGAPGWTLEAVGFDLTKLHATGTAILHQEHGDPYPHMIWPTNYNKLACGTMFTLFFAGNDFAPRLNVDEIPVQEYLQGHYINAIKQVAQKLKGLPNVVGYEPLNEPSSGFIGVSDINQAPQSIPVFIGNTPTLFQSMLLGSGYAQVVDYYKFSNFGFIKTGKRIVNLNKENAWLPGKEDVWKMHGVWSENSTGQPVLQKTDYFNRVNEHQVDFYTDYYKPFVNRFAGEIRSIAPDAIIFVEGVRSQGDLTWDEADVRNIVHAEHWYDGLTLLRNSFTNWMTVDQVTRKIVLGPERVGQCFTDQIAHIVRQTDKNMKHSPLLIGEAGIPFDMQNKKAYRNGEFSMQKKALDATMTALERNCVSFTLWNYTADNSNAQGDQWNNEDLSLFSRDQMIGSGTLHDGGRALQAAVRPYPLKIAGEPVSIQFDLQSKTFEFRFRHAEGVTSPTEIFIPSYQYPLYCNVAVSDGVYELNRESQILYYKHTTEQEVHFIRVKPT